MENPKTGKAALRRDAGKTAAGYNTEHGAPDTFPGIGGEYHDEAAEIVRPGGKTTADPMGSSVTGGSK